MKNLMTASASHVKMVVPAQMVTRCTSAHVQMDGLEVNVKMLMSVIPTMNVTMGLHVLMELTHTHVFALLDGVGRSVMKQMIVTH